LFTIAGKNEGETNLPQGSVLPSDQSMVVLALRVFLWFRNSIERGGVETLADPDVEILSANGDYAMPDAAGSAAFAAALNGSAIGNIQDCLRLYWQASESLLWSYGAGDKFSIDSWSSRNAAKTGEALARVIPCEVPAERPACV
jgi:hypothetical protein